MVVSMCASLLALAFLSFVRIPCKSDGGRVAPGHGNEEGSQETATPEILLALENEIAEGR